MWTPAILLLLAFLAITAVDGSPINGSKSRKLDESKCGGCPCSNPCTTPSYPPPPPPPVKPPPSAGYCPPPPYNPPSPPSPEIIYITGLPGSLYPVDQTYSHVGGRSSLVTLPAAFGGALVALLMLW